MFLDVLNADLIHQTQGLAQSDATGVVGGAADLILASGVGEGPVIHGLGIALFPVGAPAALRHRGVQIAEVALLDLVQAVLVDIQNAGAVGAVGPLVAACDHQVDVTLLGVDLRNAHLLNGVNHEHNALLPAPCADLR